MALTLNLISLPPMLSLLSSVSLISDFFFCRCEQYSFRLFNVEADCISHAPFDNYIADLLQDLYHVVYLASDDESQYEYNAS